MHSPKVVDDLKEEQHSSMKAIYSTTDTMCWYGYLLAMVKVFVIKLYHF